MRYPFRDFKLTPSVKLIIGLNMQMVARDGRTVPTRPLMARDSNGSSVSTTQF